MAKKRGRKINPNSQRQLNLKRKEAEQKAKKLNAKLQAEQEEKEAMLERLKALEQQALETEELKAKLKAEEELRAQITEDQSSKLEQETRAASDLEKELAAILAEANQGAKLEEPEFHNSADLMSMLNEQVTDEKNPAGSDFEEEFELDEDGDFEDDFEEGFSYHNSKENELIEEGPDLHANVEAENVRVTLDADDFADIVVDGFDALMQWGGPMAYKRMAFSREDRKRLRQLAQNARSKKKEVELDDYDLELLERFEDFEEYKETVPFSEKEKKNLLAPLKIILQNRGGDLPPGWALAYAATMVALPRLSPVLALQISKQFSHHIETEQANAEEKSHPNHEQD